MPDLFGKKQLGRATTGGRFYATPTERVEAGAVYFPDESSLLFGVAEYTVEAGNLGAFATEGTFVFEKPNDWIDAVGRKVFYRPSTGEIVNQDQKGDVLIGFQVLANVPNDKLGVLLTSGEFSVVIYVTSTADSGAGSLRQAIADAQDGDVILFDTTVFPVGQTTSIYLSSGFNISKQITINAGAARVKLDAQNSGCYFYIYNGSVNIYGVDFVNFVKDSGDGGVLYFSTGSVNLIDNCTFNNCSVARNGGAIYATSTSQNTLNNCVFYSCSAASGGGVYSGDSSQNTLNACAITSCSATDYGGGVFSSATSQSTLNDCTITGCSAKYGGGVYAGLTSQTTLNACVITGCSATTGGGFYSTGTPTIVVNNSLFTDATVYIAGQSVATIGASTFDELRITGAVALTISDITTTAAFTTSTATITFADGAALTITTSASIGAATFTSAGRGYLATAAGINTSAATLTNVVLCAYGAGLESFNISADGASWTADDLTTPILLEQKGDGAVWTTLDDDATGGSYSDTFAIGTTLRAFDGVRFFVASLDAYWQVESFVVDSNGGGGAGDDSPSWTVQDATITPNAEEV